MTPTQQLAQTRERARERWQQKLDANLAVTVGMGTCGLAAGAQDTLAAIEAELNRRGLTAMINQVGCVGMCSYEPMMELQQRGRPRLNYGQAIGQNVPEIFSHYFDGVALDQAVIVGETVLTAMHVDGLTLQSLSFVQPGTDERIPFQSKQMRIVLSNCGLVDPLSIDDTLALDGYVALEKALTGMTPEGVIEEITRSGLRGRGGGGFPAGVKWGLARKTQSWPKVVICNADEGDPGAFMDRSTLEGDPHSLVEGMIIAGYAIGAQEGYIYCRAEYPLAIQHLRIALDQARERGLLGKDILDSGFDFDILIKEGAGAFVCGEETALMASIMGERGQPRPRPPYPAVSGLWGEPSNVNNVKTYAYVPRILRLGAEWFKNLGTAGSAGTAVFALTGQVQRTGLIEVPMGITLREIICDVGGGMPYGKTFKAVQTGGPLGGCLPDIYLDTPVDFDTLRAVGAVMGSGGMIVTDQTTCMVEFAKFFMKFICDECCGKCPPCRIGSTRMLEVLERITAGDGKPGDLDEIRYLAQNMQNGSLCALGQLAPSPVLSTLQHFGEEYRIHIEEKRCPAGRCQAFRKRLVVRPELCTGCKLCELACVVEHSRSKSLLAAMLELPPPHPRLYIETIPAAPFGTLSLRPSGAAEDACKDGSQNIPAICHHCDPAPCIAACIPQAMHRASEGGAVTNVGGERDCIACSMCVMACPFGVIARAPAPNGRVMALKCDLCLGRDVPACVAACPTGALVLKQGSELVPAKATAPAVAHDALVSLSAEAAAKVLRQVQPDDVASEPTAVAEKLLALLDKRRNGV
jgi:NADH:ubiquinone oxidoreductase subunit F (NADH-binding)/Fe-S-cluster-containing hydrogenase component 2